MSDIVERLRGISNRIPTRMTVTPPTRSSGCGTIAARGEIVTGRCRRLYGEPERQPWAGEEVFRKRPNALASALLSNQGIAPHRIERSPTTSR